MNKLNELKAGIFIFVGLALFALTIFVMGQERQIFADQEEYLTTFTDVKGLAEGAPVRLGGISVGRVAQIGFAESNLDTNIKVKFLVNSKYLDRLHPDSTVSIETQGLLGDRFLNVSSGKDPQALPPGSTIRSSETGDISQVLTKAGVIVDNTVEISQNINQFVGKINKETVADLSKTISSLSNLALEIEKGNGLLHRLFYSKTDGQNIIEGLSDASKNISGIVADVKSGKGMLNALIYDPEGAKAISSLSKAADGVASFTASAVEISQQIKQGKGFAHHVIYGETPEGLDSVMKKLNEAADNLKKASEALSQGSGTIGALLIDPQIYDNLVEVTDGAKRSFLLRQAIRSSLDK